MKKLPWVKWEAGAFLNGVIGLTAEEIGVYAVVLNLIYDRNGPIKDDRVRIARRCGMRPTSFEKVFQRLVDEEKLAVHDGLISNAKAQRVIETRSKVVENWKKNLQGHEEKENGKDREIKVDSLPLEAPSRRPSRAVESESVDNKERKKESSSSSRKAKTDIDYTEEFETKVWQPYPRKKGTSKFKAFQLWRMLSEDRQQRIITTIPLFAQQMKLEGREESVIKHLERFISHKVYETLAVTSTESNVVQIPWFKTATRDQWQRALKIYEMDSNWRAAWGPKPGREGCCVPDDLVAALPYHLHPDRDRPRSQSGVAENKGPEAV